PKQESVEICVPFLFLHPGNQRNLLPKSLSWLAHKPAEKVIRDQVGKSVEQYTAGEDQPFYNQADSHPALKGVQS
ncbi:MAG: hypothetical protein ACK2UH_14545, partial [Candidatus Promineifilaceae bacterium]